MNKSISRRKWLSATALASVAFPLVKYLPEEVIQLESEDDKDSPIKLSSNENPYGPSEKAKAAILDTLSLGNRYPNALRSKLKEQLALHENLTTDHILLAAGSTEILGMLGKWLVHKQGNYLTTKLTFPILMMCTEAYNISWKKVDLDHSFQVDLNRIEDKLDDTISVIYICNPNNPTGTAIDPSALELFCKNLKPHQVILIDEAYIEYTKGGTKNSMAKLIREYPNVLVIRTFSKIYGLAGMRVGYALGNPLLIEKIKSKHIISESCISSAGLSAAMASLQDETFKASSYQKNKDTRKFITDQFDEWGIPYAASQTNFIYYPINKFERKGKSFRSIMAQHNILCPPFKQDTSNYSRMTIGTRQEMDKMISILKKMI